MTSTKALDRWLTSRMESPDPLKFFTASAASLKTVLGKIQGPAPKLCDLIIG